MSGSNSKAALPFAGDALRVPRAPALDCPDTNDLAAVSLHHDEQALWQGSAAVSGSNCITFGDEGRARCHVLRG